MAYVLSRYPASVVEAVTHPFNGLPSKKTEKGYSGLPDVADVKEACEAEAAHQERMARYAAAPRMQRVALPPAPRAPGCRASLFVGADMPGYAQLAARANEKDTDPRDWKLDPDGRPGIWVPFGWYDDFRGGRMAMKRVQAPQTTSPTPELLAALGVSRETGEVAA